MEVQKSKLAILQKTMAYHTNPRNKYKSRKTYNTFYQYPHYHCQQNYPQNHNEPLFTEECKDMKEHQTILGKCKTNPLSENLSKYKQQRAKTWLIIKEPKDPLRETPSQK